MPIQSIIKFILSFNDNKEAQAEITPVQLSDAHLQYEFLSKEAMTKVLMSNRVVSPLLFGINTNNGFSSNADEIKNASIFMHETVIRNFQDTILDNFDKILTFNEISLDLTFIPVFEETSINSLYISSELRD